LTDCRGCLGYRRQSHGWTLTIRGEREEKKENYRRVERSYGMFARSFTLPTTVDSDKVKAEYKNGLLRLSLPKREETRPKSIRVKLEP